MSALVLVDYYSVQSIRLSSYRLPAAECSKQLHSTSQVTFVVQFPPPPPPLPPRTKRAN